MSKVTKNTTSWEEASSWYHDIVGKEGHYYHQHVIFPKLAKILTSKKQDLSLLDLGCGQGAFSEIVPSNYSYDGVDISPTFIKLAKKQYQACVTRNFHLHDLCQPFDLKKTFTHATMLLSFQNIEDPLSAFTNVKKHLKQGGTLIIVLNHPCFRIPRQSSWGVDEDKKVQYRRLDMYLSSYKAPIEIHPGKKEKVITYSFHRSLQEISSFLSKTGFAITGLEEWTSDKKSTGKFAKMENKAREEFPLFLTILAKSL